MSISTIDELVNFIAGRGFSLENLYEEKVGCDWCYEAKTFDEMGADDLDVIELIMEIEKLFDCVIADECCDLIRNMNPNDLLISARRQKRLWELGI